MAALQCKQCNEPFELEGNAFWAEPTGESPRKCKSCGASLSLAGQVEEGAGERIEGEELGDETFSALSSGIIDTKRPGSNGALEREAQALARALVRAQLMDAVSDGPPSSRDDEDTVVIGPLATRAKRAALAKMAADREAKAAAEAGEQEKTLATPPSDELLEMSAPDASDRITADRITTDVAVQNSTSEPERHLPAPPPRPAPLVMEDVLEEIEAAPVSDGGTPSLQALIGHPVEELSQGKKLVPVRDKSRVPKPPERHKVTAESDEEEVVESVHLSTVEATEAPDSERSSEVSVPALQPADGSEVPTLAPTNVTAPPGRAPVAASSSRSRWATPLSFAALGSLFAVLVALRTPKPAEEQAATSEQPETVAAAYVPEAPAIEPAALAEPSPPSAAETPSAAGAATPAGEDANAAAVEPVAAVAAPDPTLATVVKDTPAAKPRSKPKAQATEPFDASAANASLAEAQARASSCRKPDDPSGVAQVTITFAPSGRVTTALVAGPPFAGTPTGGCVASTLRSARVPPFVGEPVTVRKTVTIQ